VLAHFNSDGDTKLYHFRFLPAERRAAAAVYIRDRDLGPHVRGAWQLLCAHQRVSWAGPNVGACQLMCGAATLLAQPV
jgi:hypothetical protein